MQNFVSSTLLKRDAVLLMQVEKWGSVEWAHEVDLMDLRSRLAAATLFFHLTSGSTLDGYKDN